MNVGYARVSTTDQNLESQTDALTSVDCERIYTDKISSRKAERPQLKEALAWVREGDTLVVWRLNRLARSLRELIDIVSALEKRGVGFRSLMENIDTTTPGGRLVFHIFGALAEFERDIIQENTHAGLAAARARGRLGGRARALTDEQIRMAATLAADGVPVEQICKTLSISRSTFFRYMNARKANAEEAKPKE